MNKPPLLVSACLLGQPVRYDGHGKALPASDLFELTRRYQLHLPGVPGRLADTAPSG